MERWPMSEPEIQWSDCEHRNGAQHETHEYHGYEKTSYKYTYLYIDSSSLSV